MKKTASTLALAASLALLSGAALADQFVIAHPSVNLTAGEVREVYLGEKQFAGSVKLVPVDNGALQDAFLAKMLNMNAQKYETAWIKKSFRDGLIAPPSRSGDADTLDFVKRTPGAVGYIKADRPPTGVTVITKF